MFVMWGHIARRARASPAPVAPLREVGTLGAERGVVAVAWVEPRLVGEAVEDPFGDVVDRAAETSQVSSCPRPQGRGCRR